MYVCDYCTIKFITEREVQDHIIEILITGEFPLYCSLFLKERQLTRWLEQ